ncbi:MAG: YfhO family protein, partial [Bacteroidota bacterium]
MKTTRIKKSIPHIIAIVLFLSISYAYFTPLLEGKSIKQSDRTAHIGISQELKDYRKETGEEALWTNRLFGGMPGYFISTNFPNNHISEVHSLLMIGERPASLVFICLLGFYITLLLLGVNPWISIVGAIAYAFSSYFFIIIAAGHNTKAIAIAYMAPLIASIIYTYRKKIPLGLVLTGVFLALIIKANHPQITYYAAITVVIFVIFELARSIRANQTKHFIKVSLLLLIPLVLAVGSNMGRLWTTLEYTDYSMRGQSELEKSKEQQTSGLDKDYATRWSYGIGETFTLLIPNYAGGSSQGELSTDSETYNTLEDNANIPTNQARQFIKNAPLYHGNQPFTEGAVYVGAIILFFFVFGLYIIKGPIKWWIVAATILSVMLAWGNNFMVLTNFFMEYVPAYSKFRTVSMTLVIAEFTIPLMAILALKKILNREIQKDQFWKAFKNSLYIVGGICLLFILMPGIFQDFSGPSDNQLPGWLAESLREDRKSILRQDAFRSLIFILIGAGIIAAFYYKKLKQSYALILLGVFILIDMWNINKRYLNEENFSRPQEVMNPFPKSKADEVILDDQENNFRVLNLAVNTFNDASTSYYHNSVGGYHGAKLQRYQDMIDYHIQDEMQEITNNLEDENINRQQIDNVLKNQEVLNMLNTKYIIYNKDQAPLRNDHNLGKAWFVDEYKIVADAQAEINALDDFDPKETAIVDQDFNEYLDDKKYNKDTTGNIELTHYEPNHLQYDYQAGSEQLVVFSEVYYPEGWKLMIDGEEADLFRANYILRAATVPAGKHEIEMKFEPKSYYMGDRISGYSSVILLIFLIGVIGFE